MQPSDKIIAWCRYRVYRLHWHFDLALVKRWKWRRYLAYRRRVLEIGPGGGPWTLELLRRNNDVTVVDIDLESLRRVKNKVERFPLRNRRARLVNSHVRDLSLRKQYDQIILFEVLEHIVDDVETLRNLCDHLAPGGELLISTPHSGHIPIAGETISDCEDGSHVRKGYYPEELQGLLEDCGLTVVRRETAGGWATRGMMAAANRVQAMSRSQILFHLLCLVARPLLRLDFLRPGYPPYILFLSAVRTDIPLRRKE